MHANCMVHSTSSPIPQMLAISTGKLVRYLVEDGGHIAADAPYAEVEVMKMMMTLLAPASGALCSRCGCAVVWETPDCGPTSLPALHGAIAIATLSQAPRPQPRHACPRDLNRAPPQTPAFQAACTSSCPRGRCWPPVS